MHGFTAKDNDSEKHGHSGVVYEVIYNATFGKYKTHTTSKTDKKSPPASFLKPEPVQLAFTHLLSVISKQDLFNITLRSIQMYVNAVSVCVGGIV